MTVINRTEFSPMQTGKTRSLNSITLIILAIFCLIASLGTIFTARFFVANQPPSGFSASTEPIEKNLHGSIFQIPANMMRFADERRQGTASQINLALLWPTFGGYSAANHTQFVSHSDRNPLLFVTLTAREQATASAQLLDRVYIHDFLGQTLDGQAGLVGKQLDPQSGYDSEIVWYDPLSPNPFTTRCYSAKDTMIAQNRNCMRTIALSQNIAATYRFPDTLLPYWRELDSQLVANLSNLMK